MHFSLTTQGKAVSPFSRKGSKVIWGIKALSSAPADTEPLLFKGLDNYSEQKAKDQIAC